MVLSLHAMNSQSSREGEYPICSYHHEHRETAGGSTGLKTSCYPTQQQLKNICSCGVGEGGKKNACVWVWGINAQTPQNSKKDKSSSVRWKVQGKNSQLRENAVKGAHVNSNVLASSTFTPHGVLFRHGEER